MEKEYLGSPLPDGDAPVVSASAQRDHVGVLPQHDGRSYVGFAPRAGRIAGHQLRQIAALSDEFGKGRIRTTTQQKMVILDVEPSRVEELIAALDNEDLRARASAFRTGMMACTGIEFCKLALSETKLRAQWLYSELEERLPDFDEEIRINLNGCPNSCARFQVADIGLMGATLPRSNGIKSDAFLVHLGGALGSDLQFGQKVKGVRVFAEDLADYVELLLRRYVHRKNGHASFSDYVHSLDKDQLALFAEPPSEMLQR
jgi:sulfite reductase (ferredoxin)